MTLELGTKWGKYTVTGIKKIIHGKHFPNTEITHRVALKGRRNAKATADVYGNGSLGTLRKGGFGYFEGQSILDGRE